MQTSFGLAVVYLPLLLILGRKSLPSVSLGSEEVATCLLAGSLFSSSYFISGTRSYPNSSMESHYYQEDLRPLIEHPIPPTPNPDEYPTAQDAGPSTRSEISPTISAFCPPSRGQHLGTPILYSPRTSYTSPKISDNHHLESPTTSFRQKSINGFRHKDDENSQDDAFASLKSCNENSSADGSWIRSWKHFCSDMWLLEITCAMLSFGCVVVICIILKKQNIHPLPQWPYSITLNAVISALLTLVKTLVTISVAACLGQLKWTQFSRQERVPLADFEALDCASRGALGSLDLLCHTKGRWAS